MRRRKRAPLPPRRQGHRQASSSATPSTLDCSSVLTNNPHNSQLALETTIRSVQSLKHANKQTLSFLLVPPFIATFQATTMNDHVPSGNHTKDMNSPKAPSTPNVVTPDDTSKSAGQESHPDSSSSLDKNHSEESFVDMKDPLLVDDGTSNHNGVDQLLFARQQEQETVVDLSATATASPPTKKSTMGPFPTHSTNFDKAALKMAPAATVSSSSGRSTHHHHRHHQHRKDSRNWTETGQDQMKSLKPPPRSSTTFEPKIDGKINMNEVDASKGLKVAAAAPTTTTREGDHDQQIKDNLKSAPMLATPVAKSLVRDHYANKNKSSSGLIAIGIPTDTSSPKAATKPAATVAGASTSTASSREEEDRKIKESLRNPPNIMSMASPVARAHPSRNRSSNDDMHQAKRLERPSLASPTTAPGAVRVNERNPNELAKSRQTGLALAAATPSSTSASTSSTTLATPGAFQVNERNPNEHAKSRHTGPTLAPATSSSTSTMTTPGAIQVNEPNPNEVAKSRHTGPALAPALSSSSPALVPGAVSAHERYIHELTKTRHEDEFAPAATVTRAAASVPGAVSSHERNIQELTKSGTTGPALAPAMSTASVAPAAARSSTNNNINQDDLLKQQVRETGPSLASAVSGEIQPGAFSVAAQDRAEKGNSGPSLAPPSHLALAPPSGAFEVSAAPEVTQTSSAAPNQATNDNVNEMMEAQAGLPVVFPGAFAILGMESNENEDETGVQSVSTVEDSPPQANTSVPEYETTYVQEPPALQATLAEEAMLVDNAVIVNEEDDYSVDPKAEIRMRVMKGAIIVFSLAAISMVITSVLGGFSNETNPPGLPSIVGWLQIGADLGPTDTDQAQKKFGSSVAISESGGRVIVAAPGTDSNAEMNVGEIYVFEQTEGANGTEWEPVEVLPGLGATEEAVISMATSGDARRLAAGYPTYEGGQVEYFTEVAQGWTREYLFSDSSNDNSWFGHAIDMTPDGNLLAIGAPLGSTNKGKQSGFVRVFQKDETNWVQLGEDISGEEAHEFFGWSISMRDSDGFRIAIGAPLANSDKGLVRSFDWDGSSWKRVGEPLLGDTLLNRFGESLAISEDGSILAVGAMGSVVESGQVHIYREVEGNWVMEETTVGEDDGEGFGFSLSLTSDGSVLAIGAPNNSKFGEGSGSIRVLEYNEESGTWTQLGSHIGGSAFSEYGSSVALSKDGSRLAGGAPAMTFDGGAIAVGGTRIYDRDE